MGALDRLEGYVSPLRGGSGLGGTVINSTSAENLGVPTETADSSQDVYFDTKTPEGCFLKLVHDKGFSMVGADGKSSELCDVLTTEGNQYIQAVAGSGKALRNGTFVLTTDGFRTIESIKVGDEVGGIDGSFHKVLGVYPQGKKSLYEVRFWDGYNISCSPDHLWTVIDKNGVNSTKTTLAIQNDMKDGASFTLPLVKPIEYIVNQGNVEDSDSELSSNDKLIFPPYLMGVLYSSKVTCNNGIISFHCDKDVGKRVANICKEWGIKCMRSIGGKVSIAIKEIADAEEFFYIYPSLKHIPDSYLYASVKDRRRFVQGFLDMDASINHPNYEIYTDKDSFIIEFQYILESLGCIVERFFNHNREEKSYCYGMTILMTEESGILHSCTRLDVHGLKTDNRRSIREVISYSTKDEMTCIEIDSADHLYLTEHFIPTHNTTSLIFKIMHDIITGETMCYRDLPNGTTVKVVDKVFVGTFLKSGAEELKQRLASWQRALGYTVTATQVNFGTLHAEFKHALNGMGVSTPIGDSGKLNTLFRKAVNSCNITRDGENLKNEDYRIIEGVLTYYRGRLDDKRYQHPNALDYGLTQSILDMLNRQYSNLKQASGVMDFEDLQELLYKFLYITPNPAVQEYIANRYNYMYLDEFQDTSQIQYALIKAYMGGVSKNATLLKKGKIVVVGDVQQCIYSFRGSDIEVMHSMFDEDFESTHNALSYNYRCPSNILKPVVPSIMLNPESEGIKIYSKTDGGDFHIRGYKSSKQMLASLSEELQKDMENDMSVAILCRTNYDGMIPALYLEMLGKFNFSVSSETMTLSSPLAKSLVRVSSIFTDRGTPALKTTLEMIAPFTERYGVKELCSAMKANKMRLCDVPLEDISYSCYHVGEFVKWLRGLLDGGSPQIEVLKAVYWKLRGGVFAKDNQYCESARSIIDVLLFYLENNTFDSVQSFNASIDDLDEQLHARIGANSPISIATVHEFKGKERDSIYVWNDSEDVFPTVKTDLTDEIAMSEERRVHYIACTRAKKKSTIMCSVAYPSVFVKEMDAEVELFNPEIHGSL